MKCRDYIFSLTSGQLHNASPLKRTWIKKHLLICQYCRRFTKNDKKLDLILHTQKERLLEDFEPKISSNNADTANTH